MREEPALFWLLPLAESWTLPLYTVLKPIFQMDKHIELIWLSYMWEVFLDKIWHCETFAIKALTFVGYLVVDFYILNNFCKMQTQNQVRVFPLHKSFKEQCYYPTLPIYYWITPVYIWSSTKVPYIFTQFVPMALKLEQGFCAANNNCWQLNWFS